MARKKRSQQQKTGQAVALPLACLLRDPDSEDEWHRTIEAWSRFLQRHARSEHPELRAMAAMTRLRRAAGYAYLREYEAALADLEELLAASPAAYETCKAYELRASVLCERRRDQEALSAWTEAIAHSQEAGLSSEACAELYLERGKCLARLKRHQEAIADFKCAIERNAGCAEAWCWQGLSLAYIGEDCEALTSCTHALQLDAATVLFWRIRGIVHRICNHFKEALADIDHALQLAPSDPVLEEDKRQILFKWLLVGDPFVSSDTETIDGSLSLAVPALPIASSTSTVRHEQSTDRQEQQEMQPTFF